MTSQPKCFNLWDTVLLALSPGLRVSNCYTLVYISIKGHWPVNYNGRLSLIEIQTRTPIVVLRFGWANRNSIAQLLFILSPTSGSRLRLKCDGTRAETSFLLSTKRTSPFKSGRREVSSVDYWQASCAHQPAGFVLLVQACVLQSRDAYWLPTPFSCFPFTSPPVRHRVPSHFKSSIWLVPWETSQDSTLSIIRNVVTHVEPSAIVPKFNSLSHFTAVAFSWRKTIERTACDTSKFQLQFKVCKSVRHHTIQINQQTRCYNFFHCSIWRR
jgi:hypothetical protein